MDPPAPALAGSEQQGRSHCLVGTCPRVRPFDSCFFGGQSRFALALFGAVARPHRHTRRHLHSTGGGERDAVPSYKQRPTRRPALAGRCGRGFSMLSAVAIVGRPNVGKSTLFNRLAGRRAAIVHDTPGVTRDRNDAELRWGDLAFRLIDTAGFDDSVKEGLARRMTAQTRAAIAEADVCLFLIDARAGVTAS